MPSHGATIPYPRNWGLLSSPNLLPSYLFQEVRESSRGHRGYFLFGQTLNQLPKTSLVQELFKGYAFIQQLKLLVFLLFNIIPLCEHRFI